MADKMRNTLMRLSLAYLALLLTGCVHYTSSFTLSDESFKPRGKTMAVISGSKEEQSVLIAQLVSESLRKKSRFQMLPTSQVASIVKPYPLNIDGPYKSAYFSIDTDWELGDRKKIAQIHHSLGVDYLYVIWAPVAVKNGNVDVINVYGVGQMFDSNGKVVAQSEMGLLLGDEGNQYLKEGVEGIADEIAEKTHMSRNPAKGTTP